MNKGVILDLIGEDSTPDNSEVALTKMIQQKPKESGIITINQSRIKVWDLCHRQHYYKYILQLPEESGRSRALQFGTSFHWLVEQREDNHGVPAEQLQKIFEPIPGKFNEDGSPFIVDDTIDPVIYGEALQVFREYEFYYRHNPFKYHPIGGKNTELLMELNTGKGVKLKGTADGFIEYEDQIWLIDHKTFGRAIPDMHELTFSRQAAFYYYMVEKLYGIKLGGIMWDYVRSKVPAKPRWSGSTFYKPSQQVLPLAAGEFMVQHKLSPMAHSRYLQQARNNGALAFHRIPVARDESVHRQMLGKIQSSITEIKTIGKTAREPHISMKCNWCSWRPQCMLENKLAREKKVE